MTTLASERLLRAGFAPALPLHVLLGFVRALRSRAPDLAVDVTHLSSVDQLERLRAGELDLAIVVEPHADPELEIEPLFPGEPLAACLPVDHRLAERQMIQPSDVSEETLVCSGRSINPAAYERTLAGFAAAGYRFRNVEEAAGNTAREIVFAVASGQGMALVPVSLAELNDVGDVILRPLDPPLRLPSTAVAWHANSSPRLRPILAAVRSAARELFESDEGDESSQPATDGHARLAVGAVTARQLDVLRLLADGRSTGDIATELGLSQTTVRNHVAGLMAALGVHTRLQAVIAAKRAGLLDL